MIALSFATMLQGRVPYDGVSPIAEGRRLGGIEVLRVSIDVEEYFLEDVVCINGKKAAAQMMINQAQHTLLIQFIKQGESLVGLVGGIATHQFGREAIAFSGAQGTETLTEIMEPFMTDFFRESLQPCGEAFELFGF